MTRTLVCIVLAVGTAAGVAAQTEHGVVTDSSGSPPTGCPKAAAGTILGWQLFEYSGLSAADAAFFDRMLDTLWYAAPVETSALPKR